MSSVAPDSARTALRAATREAHERTDAIFSRFDLGARDSYRDFLLAQARAYLPVEAALDRAGADQLVEDWGSRRRADALIADLAALGCAAPASEPFSVEGDAAVLGAAYVLEGSRMGGAMLASLVGPGLPTTYLATRQSPGAWRKLLASLENRLYDPAQRMAAIASARAVFEQFEAAATEQLGRSDW